MGWLKDFMDARKNVVFIISVCIAGTIDIFVSKLTIPIYVLVVFFACIIDILIVEERKHKNNE